MISQNDVKRALDNCMWEHMWVEGRSLSELSLEAQALGRLFVAMVDKKRSEITEERAGPEVAAAINKWKDHERSRLRAT